MYLEVASPIHPFLPLAHALLTSGSLGLSSVEGPTRPTALTLLLPGARLNPHSFPRQPTVRLG